MTLDQTEKTLYARNTLFADSKLLKFVPTCVIDHEPNMSMN